MRKFNRSLQYLAIAAAASAAVSAAYGDTTPQPAGTSIPGNTNGNDYATISLSGSTALRNDTISAGETYLPNGATIFLSSGTFTASTPGAADQLAPLNSDGTGDNTSSVVDAPALRFEWHEQGSVEGDIELVADQLYGGNVNNLPAGQAPITLVTRAPTVSNPVWINRTTVSSDNSNTNTARAGSDWAYGVTGTSTGQNLVQMAIADVKPIQAFSVSGGTASPFNTPGTAGYGKGNPLGVIPTDTSGLGVVGSREQLVDQSVLNIPDAANPSAPWTSGGISNLDSTTVAVTATDFAANPGTGLTNVNKTDAQFLELTGRLQNGATFQMSTRDTNSGTRNTAANNIGIDPSWAVGVNDGGNTLVTTNPTAADNQDIIDDNSVIALDGTSIPNTTIRYSGKTSGGVLRTTIENSRMGVGTLSVPDSISGSGSLHSAYTGGTPLRVLTYNGVSPTAANITTGAYAIWQQEQYGTVKNTNSTFSTTVAANYNQSQWAATTDLQTGIMGDTPNTSAPQTGNFSDGSITLPTGSRGGYVQGQVIAGTGIAAGTTVTGVTYNPDGTIASVQISDPSAAGTLTYTDSGGDVANFRDNVTNAIRVAGGTVGFGTITNPGDTLITTGYILPQFMKVTKPYDGAATAANTAFDINSNPSGYIGDTLYNEFINSTQGQSISPPLPTITSPNSNSSSAFGYYGQAVRGGGQAGTGVVSANPVYMNNGSIAITPSNYLFGDFANNGIRDYQSFQYAVAALEALYNSGDGVDSFDATSATGVTASGNASNATVLTDAQLDDNGVSLGAGSLSSKLGSSSTFVGQRGPSGAAMSYTSPNAFGTGVSKGDLIVMGDYNGDGRFDGKDIYAMAIGTALSENTSTNTLNSLADINTGVLRKNAALDFTQASTADATYSTVTNSSGTYSVASNASAFIRQSAREILSTTASMPAGATELYTASGQNSSGGMVTTTSYTFDPLGANSFNKSDVNQDGVVDFNDAVLVDQYAGQSYTNALESVGATEPAPVTGASQEANLVLIQQIDGEAAIGSADLAVVNAALTGGNLTTNWYGCQVTKTGTGTITWQGSTGTKVNFNAGASMQISSGTVQVMSAMDPFTDNNANLPASATDTSKSLAITVTGGGELEYTDTSTSGILLDRLSSLTIGNGGKVSVDTVANHADRTLLLVGSLSIASGTVATGVPSRPVGATLDLGNNDLDVQNGDVNAITSLVASAYTGGTWAGTGITSSAAASDTTHLTALGVISNNGPSGKLYGTGTTMGLFDGSNPAATDVLVKYTYYGDANLDGVVDASDYSLIDNGYLNGLTGWYNGDFNYDGVVNGSDYTLIDNAFNTQGASLAAEATSPTVQIADEIGAPAVVPEPTTLGLLGAGVVSLLGRRRRRA